MERKVSSLSGLYHYACSKKEVGFFMIIISVILSPVQPTPQLVQTPNDTYVFKDMRALLRCEVRDAENYAIVWQYVFGTGSGEHIGRCYVCPASRTCELTPRYSEGVYSVTQNDDIFQLNISSAAIPTPGQTGHYECAYIDINCDAAQTIPSNAKYRLLASTNLFVYDDPQCIAASGPPNELRYIDFTCLKYPRVFRDDSGVATHFGFEYDKGTNSPQFPLPFGVFQRVPIDSNLDVNSIIIGATCTVTLPSGVSSTQHCRQTGIYMNPSIVRLTGGQTQSMNCTSDHGADAQRQWYFFRQETLSEISASEAGGVQFTSDTNVTLEFTPRNDTKDLIVECVVEKMDGNVFSAFALVFMNQDALNGSRLNYGEVENAQSSTSANSQRAQSSTSATSTTIGFITYSNVKDGDGDGVNLTLILVIVSPLVAIALFTLICILVVKKRRGNKSVKQPPRSPDATFQCSTSNVTTGREPNQHVRPSN